MAVVPALEDPIGAAPDDDRACHGPRDAATLADAGDVADAGQGRLVRGFGCGTASGDSSGSPQVVTSEGTIVLGSVGRGENSTRLDVELTIPGPSPTVGTFTLTTRRGSITFSSVGTATNISPEVGQRRRCVAR